ncbi:MAG: exodeoxyribonuclease VII small subunit [bacterium]|nr:exodeoxyribonuclease VII small subunit [bacterium]MDZ4299538.1 exodeoxyribonuclease VII small subunit [Candidatus Sungbacteria bacterium]
MAKTNLSESLKRLGEIVAWFDNQDEVDVEKGLEKVREGAVLIKQSRTRLAEVENEFQELKKEMEETETDED